MLQLDHLAVSATTLEEGVAAVESALGVPLAGGGKHPLMATHNRLLSLGDLYLEVIAPDPEAPRPDRPRWFDMDNFTGFPRLTNWICRTDDLAQAIAASPPGTGTAIAFQRGDYVWQMAVPDDGKLPFNNAFPALIQWQGPHHPAAALPKSDVRLTRLEIVHPEAMALRKALASRFKDPRVVFVSGSDQIMRARFTTPHGTRYIT
ncbi:Glyoxalase-like domain containing protein [Paracoccaceae bacterium]